MSELTKTTRAERAALDKITVKEALLLAQAALTLEQKNTVYSQDNGWGPQNRFYLGELIDAALENEKIKEDALNRAIETIESL